MANHKELPVESAAKSGKIFPSKRIHPPTEEQYFSLVENAPDIIFVVDFKGNFLYINKTAQQISGYPLSDLLEKKLQNLIVSEHRDSVKKMFKGVHQKSSIPLYEVDLLSANGNRIPLDIHLKSIKDSNGKMIGLHGIARDITERKKVEQALRESEKKYSTLVEKAKDGVVIIQDGICRFANKAVKNISGYSPDELIGKSVFDILHPEDRKDLTERYKLRIENKKVPSVYNARIFCKEGRVKEVEVSASMIPYDGRPADMAVVRDISERKITIEKLNQAYHEVQKIKAKLKAIIDNAPNIAIQGYNKKGEVMFWNPSSEKLFGLDESRIKGKSLKGILISEAEEKKFLDTLNNIFLKKESSSLMEWSTTTKSGETRHVLCSIFPLFPPQEEPIAIAMNVDITERKRAEEKIKEMNRQLERFSEISADILSIEDDDELFFRIAQAVVDISDFKRVLISYFVEEPPYREIIGYRGVKKEDLERVKKVSMPREKYLKYFDKCHKIGSQSCYIPYTLKNILDQNAVIPGEQIYPEKKGRWHREDNLLVSMKDAKGNIMGIISVDDSKSGNIPSDETVKPLEIYANLISEIIQRRKLTKKIKKSEEKYRDLISNIKVGVFRATPEGELLEANPSALELFGFHNGKDFLKLKTKDLYFHAEDNERFMKEIAKKGTVKNKEYLLKKKDGFSFWASITSAAVEDIPGRIVYYDTVIEDITERKKLEEEVKRLSVTDELTGLFNRRYFNEHLPGEIKTAERWKSGLSLIMIDIDDFKPYNDSYHHLKGDEVIKEVAQVIYRNIRKGTDWASRFGGDEYAIILPGTDLAEAKEIAERIRESFHHIKFIPEGNIIQKTISMGIAHSYYHDAASNKRTQEYERDYEKIAAELTSLADKALFKAKKSGKNKVYTSKKSIKLSRLPAQG